MEALLKAGVSVKDVLSGGLSGSLDLAAAGGLDLAIAAETAASAMTQFKLSGDQVPRIADALAAGAGKAQGDVSDLAQALGQSGLVASQFGLSLEDTVGGLSAFASAGLMGSDAGTSMKTMKPTSQGLTHASPIAACGIRLMRAPLRSPGPAAGPDPRPDREPPGTESGRSLEASPPGP